MAKRKPFTFERLRSGRKLNRKQGKEVQPRLNASDPVLEIVNRDAAGMDVGNKSHSHHATEPMGDCPDGGLIAQPRQQTPEHRLKMGCFFLTAAWAAWFSTRRRYLLPLAERLLWFSSALSSLSGTGSHPRGQLCRRGKRAGLYPTSEITGCAESTPKPGTSASRITVS
jgi:hypothetical protein